MHDFLDRVGRGVGWTVLTLLLWMALMMQFGTEMTPREYALQRWVGRVLLWSHGGAFLLPHLLDRVAAKYPQFHPLAFSAWLWMILPAQLILYLGRPAGAQTAGFGPFWGGAQAVIALAVGALAARGAAKRRLRRY